VVQELKSVQEQLIQAKSDLNPQKKFSFKSKKKPANTTSTVPHKSSGESSTSVPAEARKASGAIFEETGTQVRDLQGQKTRLATPGQDVAISDITGSKIFLTEPTTAVRVNKAKSSVFVFAPVAGSVFIEDCEDCTFVVACHQVRILFQLNY
jgi:hypothetical protein